MYLGGFNLTETKIIESVEAISLTA
jgi:hypothetical protein